MAQQYGQDIRIEHGNMQDLSRFSDDSFDYIVNPISLCYVPSVHPVFRESYRVLKKAARSFWPQPIPSPMSAILLRMRTADITELIFMTKAIK